MLEAPSAAFGTSILHNVQKRGCGCKASFAYKCTRHCTGADLKVQSMINVKAHTGTQSRRVQIPEHTNAHCYRCTHLHDAQGLDTAQETLPTRLEASGD